MSSSDLCETIQAADGANGGYALTLRRGEDNLSGNTFTANISSWPEQQNTKQMKNLGGEIMTMTNRPDTYQYLRQ
jgi:hypothetical protein